MVKTASISVQTIGFEFKRTNKEAIPHYRPSAPTAGGSARPGSNAGANARSGQAIAMPPTRRVTLARAAVAPGALAVASPGRT
jgi:hypothetical protein